MLRRRPFLASFALLLCLLGVKAAAAGPAARIIVAAPAVPRPLPALLFGYNVVAAGNGLWDHRRGGPDPEAVWYLHRLAPTVLRFPGGSLSDWYLWEDGLGVVSSSPIPPQLTTLTLIQPPWWEGGRRLRFLSRQGGRYGEVVPYAGARGQEIDGLQARKQAYPAGVSLRPEGRDGQPAWYGNEFGSAEFFQLCQQLGAVPILTVNYGSGLDARGRVTPRVSLSQRVKRAAAWVAYANGDPRDQRPLGVDEEGHDWQTVGFWASRRAAAGRPEPWRVRFWEIGNEVYEPQEIGAAPADQYAQDVPVFARTLKEVDPDIQIGAVARLTPTAAGNAAADPWNATLLAQAGAAIDFLAVHLYYPTALLPEAAYQEQTWLAGVMAAASQARRHLQQLRRFLDEQGPAGQRLKIAVTEYGIWPAGSQRAADYANLARALYEADLLMSLAPQAETLGVIAAAAWNLHGQNHTAAIHFDFASHTRRLRPQFLVGEIWRYYRGGTMLSAQVQGPVLQTPQVGNVPSQSQLPQLNVLATVDEAGQATLLVLNRSWQDEAAAEIEFAGQTSLPWARLFTLTAPSLAAHNENAASLLSWQTADPAPQQDRQRVYTFPPRSLTGYRVHLQP
jgi:alpha-L-arabinofuranosidase